MSKLVIYPSTIEGSGYCYCPECNEAVCVDLTDRVMFCFGKFKSPEFGKQHYSGGQNAVTSRQREHTKYDLVNAIPAEIVAERYRISEEPPEWERKEFEKILRAEGYYYL